MKKGKFSYNNIKNSLFEITEYKRTLLTTREFNLWSWGFLFGLKVANKINGEEYKKLQEQINNLTTTEYKGNWFFKGGERFSTWDEVAEKLKRAKLK